MSATKRELQHALPFAMEPVVYDFAINERGTFADLLDGRRRADARRLLHADRARAAAPGPPLAVAVAPRRAGQVRRRLPHQPELRGMVQTLFDVMLPRGKAEHGRGADAGRVARASTASTARSTSRSAPT